MLIVASPPISHKSEPLEGKSEGTHPTAKSRWGHHHGWHKVSRSRSAASLRLLDDSSNALIPSVVACPLRGEVPTIDLMMGYNKSNTSPLLKRFLLRADELVHRGSPGEAYSRTLKRGDRKVSV